MVHNAVQVYFHWVVRESQLAYFRDTLETIAQDDVRARSRCLLIATTTCLLLPDLYDLHWHQSCWPREARPQGHVRPGAGPPSPRGEGISAASST